MSAKTADQLADTVREAYESSVSWPTLYVEEAEAALAELVSRLQTAEAEVASAERQTYTALANASEYERRANAAEAAVREKHAEGDKNRELIRTTEARVATLTTALEEIERMAGAAGAGEVRAAPIASRARRALGESKE